MNDNKPAMEGSGGLSYLGFRATLCAILWTAGCLGEAERCATEPVPTGEECVSEEAGCDFCDNPGTCNGICRTVTVPAAGSQTETSVGGGDPGGGGGGTPAMTRCNCVPLGDAFSSGSSGTSAGTTGVWSCQTSGPAAPDSSITVTLTPDDLNRLALFDFADIGPDAIVRGAHILDDLEDLTGTFELAIGIGPAEAVPVTMTALNITVSSVPVLGMASGLNIIELAPGAETVEGLYNANEGTIHFARAIPAVVYNDLAPRGLGVGLTPWIIVGETCRVHPIASAAGD